MIIPIDPGERDDTTNLEIHSGPDDGLQLVATVEMPVGQIAATTAGMKPDELAGLEYRRFFRDWDDLMQVINALWQGGQDAFGPARDGKAIAYDVVR
jgi:hypothetical protein